MANGFQKITDFFKNMIGSKEHGRGKTYPNRANLLYEQMAVEIDRRKIYQECWVMYVEDSRISAAVDTTAGSATNGGFTFKFNNVKSAGESVLKDAEEIMENIVKKTKMKSKIPGIAKELLILGDVFLEVIVDFETNTIADLKKLPARTIERQEDEYGNLTGFIQRNDLNEIIARFEPWQILHMRWNHFTGQLYGTSMIRGIRKVYKKLKMTEEDLVVRRRTRAGVKLHHYGSNIEDPLEEDEVDEYMDRNTSTPLNVRTDFYSNGKWKIDVLKSDDGVNEINDIVHFENSLFIGLRTPKGLLGMGDNSNKATLERQEVAYIRLLDEIDDVLTEQIVPVFDLGLQLQGINPDQIDYELVWKEKSIEDNNKKVERLILQSNSGSISKQTSTTEMGYNFEDEMQKIEDEQKKYEHLQFNQTKFMDPNSILQSSREKVKHQSRGDDGKENTKTRFKD